MHSEISYVTCTNTGKKITHDHHYTSAYTNLTE